MVTIPSLSGPSLPWPPSMFPVPAGPAVSFQPDASSTQSLRIQPVGLMVPPTGQSAFLDFMLTDGRNNQPVQTLEVIHERPMHMFVIRQDLAQFQHIHPTLVAPGRWQVPIALSPGRHRVFIQAKPPGTETQTLSGTLHVGNTPALPPPLPLPDAHLEKRTADGYAFRLRSLPSRTQPEGMITVEITRNGQPVKNLMPLLGAGGHAIVVSQDLQTFLHTHPMGQPVQGLYASPLTFHTQIPRPGLYKMWLQVQLDGQVRTLDWAFWV